MNYRLFDLHCDTAFKMYRSKGQLKSNDLNIALDKTDLLKKYVQIAAIWSDSNLSDDEAYNEFWRILMNFKAEIEVNRQRAAVCRSFDELLEIQNGMAAFFIAVEDARILSGNVERIYELYDAGVRFISLNWSGLNSLGGAYDTNASLTHLGRTVVRKALDLGMVLDVSHSSAAVTDEIISFAKEIHRPVIASHSNSYSVFKNKRNLTDKQFCDIKEIGGIVGISLESSHLCSASDRKATIDDVINHIEYFLGLDGQHTVCLGCDFDGAYSLPEEIASISDIYRLADKMAAKNFSNELINAILYQNAYNFVKKLS